MMRYKGYVGKTQVDEAGGIIHGEVLGIRDVVTFQAGSVRELRKAFRDSVDDYLAFCKERGEEPNRPFSGQVLLRIDAELHRQAAMAAALAGKSLNALVAESISSTVKQELGLAKSTDTRRSARHRRSSRLVAGESRSARY